MKLFNPSIFVFTICYLFFGFLQSPAFAEGQHPSSCYQHFPEWDQAVKTGALLAKADAMDVDVKQHQLETFAALKQRHDLFYNGTAPICGELAILEDKVKSHNIDAADRERQLSAHNAMVEKFNAQCSVVNTIQEQQSCHSWAEQINNNKATLDNWASKIESRKTQLDSEALSIKNRGDKINTDWKASVNKFIADANEVMTSLPPKAGEFVSILNKAAERTNPTRNKDPEVIALKCQEFFKAVGILLGGEANEEWHRYGDANNIYKKVTTDTSKWKNLNDKTGIELQVMANNGAIIVGVSQGKKNGHVAIISPVPPGVDLDQFGGQVL